MGCCQDKRSDAVDPPSAVLVLVESRKEKADNVRERILCNDVDPFVWVVVVVSVLYVGLGVKRRPTYLLTYLLTVLFRVVVFGVDYY